MDTDRYEFSPDPARIDGDWVHATLRDHAYWAEGRSRADQDAANAASRCFGVYRRADGGQVAFARVITDGVTFGWVADVVVAPEVRGQGIGKALVAAIAAQLDALGVRRSLLITRDAHALYSRNGWVPVEPPENWMLRPRG
ncbi:GNAT family N-acetyltransferase [Microbacterium gilvum]|uniref:GNAT family N-acetyltransferase n=1 Tax=Microbacterium gilvum TaxID=1336204 RepID=A0ABP8ZZF1_9MICO